MSCHSTIALKTGYGSCLAIRCHYDGYPAHHGPILMSAYDTEEKVRALLALGDLSVLGPELGEKHDFRDQNHPTWCLAYGRDRGERNTEACNCTIEEVEFGFEDADFNYLFDPALNVWLVSGRGLRFIQVTDHPDMRRQAAAPMSA